MASKRSIRPFKMTPLSWTRAIWKQKTVLGIAWLACSITGAAVVYFLPAVYKANVIILVESQRIPQNFVAPTVGEDLKERLSNLKQQILSYSRLLEIVKKFDLYARERKTLVEEQIIEKMRGDINVELEKGGSPERPGAFRISYKGQNPTVVALVTNQLGNLFIEENLRAREFQATGTSEFLESQLAEASRRLEEQEAKLSTYKLKYNGELPQQENALLSKVAQLQLRLQGVQDAATRAQQNKVMGETSLKLAQDSLATLTQLANKAEGDPASVFSATAVPPSKQLQDHLKNLQTVYTNDHPDVIRTRKLLLLARQMEAEEEKNDSALPQEDAAAREALQTKQKSRSLLVTQSLEREHERVEQLKSQLAIASKQITDYDRERQEILHEIASVQGRVDQLPLREQEMASVTRDYQISKANYQSLLDKKLAAGMASDMEHRQKSERFTMIEPARVPEKPTEPDRPILFGISLLGSLVVATVIALAREMHRDVLLGEWELPAGLLVLARLPLVQPNLPHTQKWRRPAMVIPALLLMAALTGAVYFTLGRL